MAKQKKEEEVVTLDSLEKKYGFGKPVLEGKKIVPTGSLALNEAMYIGGTAVGKIIELFGAESCISGDTFLRFIVEENGKQINSKGGTIRRLWERFNRQPCKIKAGQHLIKYDVDYYILSKGVDDRIMRNKVLDVVKTGIKPVYEVITAKGLKIKTTLEHKFCTPLGYKELKELNVGDDVLVHDNKRVKGRKIYEWRKDILVKNHPTNIIKVVTDRTNGIEYTYKRLPLSHFYYEAHLNNFSPKQWREILNSKTDLSEYKFISKNFHIHHKDEDYTNNNIDNLIMIDPSVHGKLHATDRIKNLSFIPDSDSIISIEYIGEEETFDIKCAYPFNNYVANKFIVHNSGKSTLTLYQMREYQKAFPDRKVALLDYENCLSGETLIYIPDIGKNLRCDELINLKDFKVLSKMGDELVVQNATIQKLINKKLITTILTERGVEIKLTENHKVLTNVGYKEVKDLEIGDCLVKPTNINCISEAVKDDCDLDLYFLLGFYLGDGANLKSVSTPNIANVDPIVLSYIEKIINKYDCKLVKQGKCNWRISSLSSEDWKINIKELQELFESGYTLTELGVHFKISKETIRRKLIKYKIVPVSFNFRKHASSLRNKKRCNFKTVSNNEKEFSPNFITSFLRLFKENQVSHTKISLPEGLSNEKLIQFISGYITADGFVMDYDKQKKAQLLISSTSRRMMKDIESSLLKFNITSRVEKIKEKNSKNFGYRLVISGLENLIKINSKFKLLSYKKERLEKIISKHKITNVIPTFEHLKIKNINRESYVDTVYDISVDNINFDYQNFLCENVIVHNSYDKLYAKTIGVNVDDLLVYQPDTMEQGYDLIIDLVKNKFVSCVVVDSQTAATPKAVLEGEMEDSTIGLQARLNSKFCLKIKGLLNSNDVTLFFISQLRDMIGVSYGDPSVTTGGKAIKFYSDIRWKVRKSVDKDNEMNKTIVEVVKSKVGKPFGVAELGILWGVGIDRLGEIITYGTRFGFIEKTGAWLNVADTKFHGESNLREFLSDNDGLADELETKINEKIYGTGISECENQEVDGE